MKRVWRLACCMLLSVVTATACLAQGLSVDWKFYGGASIQGNSDYDYCFYDAKGVAPTHDGHIRVWTKCLLGKDLDNIDVKTELGDRVVKNTAQKLSNTTSYQLQGLKISTWIRLYKLYSMKRLPTSAPLHPAPEYFTSSTALKKCYGN